MNQEELHDNTTEAAIGTTSNGHVFSYGSGVSHRGDWMQTASGRAFYPCDPEIELIVIEDIAHSLARQCRFAGHTLCDHYSVAEHCVRASHIVPPALALTALLHDAAEAYVVDVPRPVKSTLGTLYSELERRVAAAIGLRFGVELVNLHPDVKHADEVMLSTEARDLMGPPPQPWHPMPAPLQSTIEPWSVEEAQERYLLTFHALGGRHLPARVQK